MQVGVYHHRHVRRVKTSLANRILQRRGVTEVLDAVEVTELLVVFVPDTRVDEHQVIRRLHE